MSIEIKKSEKPVIYEDAKKLMEERLLNLDLNKSNELIWTLEHPDIYTAGTSYNESDILDKSIKILETNRGGKITYHGPGQLICYFVIDLKKRKKDIRNFISIIEKTIIDTLQFFNIKTFSDKENIKIILDNLYNENVQSLLVEGGGTSSTYRAPRAFLAFTPHAAHLVVQGAMVICAALGERWQNSAHDFELALQQ